MVRFVGVNKGWDALKKQTLQKAAATEKPTAKIVKKKAAQEATNPFVSPFKTLAEPEKKQVVRGDKDDQACWDFDQTGQCPRFPCKWGACKDRDLDDPCFANARISKKYLIENGMTERLEIEEAKRKAEYEERKAKREAAGIPHPTPKGAKKGAKGSGKKGGVKGANTTVIKTDIKKKGTGKKAAEKKELTGPNGEEADDQTCWDVKQTGFCKRFPCKWQPCCDLPRDDPIFSQVEDRRDATKKTKGAGKRGKGGKK